MFSTRSDRAGQIITQMSGPDGYQSFVPKPLPPEPPMDYDDEIKILSEKANRALGRLDSITSILPNPKMFMYIYVRKEAVLSSQIEGTQASMTDLLEFEAGLEKKSTPDDTYEVSNYTKAIYHGLDRLETLPLSSRLLKEIHAILLKDTRGGHKNPGEYRRSQNWIGGTKPSDANFVPPPPHEVERCMGALERFIQEDNGTPPLMKAGLAHAQFETIHPFLDGNGRIGRLLITFMLCHDRVIETPLLYLSLFFMKNRSEYYERLNAVRRDGDWENWMKFFLTGVFEVSMEAVEKAKKIMNLLEEDRAKITALKKAAASALKLHEQLVWSPVITVPKLTDKMNVSQPTARSAVLNLVKLGILTEVGGRKRDKEYIYMKYLELIL